MEYGVDISATHCVDWIGDIYKSLNNMQQIYQLSLIALHCYTLAW